MHSAELNVVTKVPYRVLCKCWQLGDLRWLALIAMERFQNPHVFFFQWPRGHFRSPRSTKHNIVVSSGHSISYFANQVRSSVHCTTEAPHASRTCRSASLLMMQSIIGQEAAENKSTRRHRSLTTADQEKKNLFSALQLPWDQPQAPGYAAW
ncbi:hypothetical protein BGZ63DRAFT_1751 [Mariannaea sp. PMI_226]|nr:hypothetical protein BGZ63DRAFT_1751 [Mariannaea sp. PMI_226]